MDRLEKRKKEQQLNRLLDEMPVFIRDYFRAIMRHAINTRIQYAYDLKGFLSFLTEEVDIFRNIKISEMTYEDLNRITLEHIDLYLEYITYYETEVFVKNSSDTTVVTRQNNEYGLNRKMACLKSLFKHLYDISLSKNEEDPNKLEKNLSPLIKLQKPKIKQKYLMDYETIENFLLAIKNGVGTEGKLNEAQYKYIKRNTLERDLCIISILAETGIRISELVNMNIDDIDFKRKQFKVVRKGGNEEMIYYDFSDSFIRDYYEIRKEQTPKKGYEKAFFLSLQKRRITPRAVQLMIEKYAKIETNKRITPHTFRRSFATNLYEETRDVYLVASLIGDTVNVAVKHYTKMNENLKRDAVSGYLKGKINVENEDENN